MKKITVIIVISLMMLICGLSIIYASPTIDGKLDSGYTLLYSTTANARTGFGSANDCSGIYYTYDTSSVYFFIQGNIDTSSNNANGNGIAVFFGSSTATNYYPAGYGLGNSSGSNGIFTQGGNGNFYCDFTVASGVAIAVYPSGGSYNAYVNDATYTGPSSPAINSGYIGDITSSGSKVSGGATGYTCSFNFSANTTGLGNSTGFEIAISRNGGSLGLGNLKAGIILQAFAIVLNNTDYFSNDGVPTNFPNGNQGGGNWGNNVNFGASTVDTPGPDHVTTSPLEDFPSAGFSASTQSGYGALTVVFSDTSYGIITGWNWNFGDGSSTTIQNPTHVYGVVSAPTTYKVTFVVTNLLGTSTATTNISVTEVGATAAYTVDKNNGNGPLTVTFRDNSSYPNPSTFTTWSWVFGDGNTGNGATTSHIYLTVTAPTTYTAFEIVSTAFGVSSSSNQTITITEAPSTAAFTVNKSSGNGPLTVTFMDNSVYPTSSSFTTWKWVFGDGYTASSATTQHIYAAVTTTTNYTSYEIVSTPFGVSTSSSQIITVDGQVSVITPTLDGKLDSGYTLLWSTSAPARNDLGTGDNVSAVYYTYDSKSIYFFFQGSLDTVGNGIAALFGSSVSNGYNAGWLLGQDSGSNNAIFTLGTNGSSNNNGNGNWGMDFPVSDGLYIAGYVGDKYLNDAIYSGNGVTSSSETSGYIGDITSNGLIVSGSVSGAAATFNNSGDTSGPGSSNGFEIAFSRNGTLGKLTAGSTVSAFGVVVSHTGYFSNDGVPMNFPVGTVGFDINFDSTGSTEGPGPNHVITPPLEDVPFAGFSASTQSGFGVLTVLFSDTSYGIISSWNWNFGDGNSTTIQNPTHIYGTVSAPTTFVVTLIVNNLLGVSTATTTITVKEPAPSAGFTASPSSGNGPLPVTFTDTSLNNPTGWSWKFGDGNSGNTQNTTYTYAAVAAPTTYTVLLIVTNSFGTTTATGSITVTEAAPSAGFTQSVLNTYGPLTVNFTDTTVNENGAVSWSWTFGDGSTSSAQNPQHVYLSVPTTAQYAVQLVVTTPFGMSSSVPQTVTVTEAGPIAAFSPSPTSGYGALTVNFTNQSNQLNGSSTTWNWIFGDGQISSAENPTNVYAVVAAPTTYTAKLVVTTNFGMSTATTVITVTEPPPSVSLLQAPADNLTTLNVPLLFSWSSATDSVGSSINYTLRLGLDTGFTSMITTITGISSTSYTIPSLPTGPVYWDIQANSVFGSSTSTTQQVIVYDTTDQRAVATSETVTFYLGNSLEGILPVTIVFNTTNADTVTITTMNTKAPGLPSNYYISRYWSINRLGSGALDAAVTFSYTTVDFNASGLSSETLLFPADSTITSTWSSLSTNGMGITRDIVNHTLTISGLNEFSLWTLGGAGGVAVELSNFTAENDDQLPVDIKH